LNVIIPFRFREGIFVCSLFIPFVQLCRNLFSVVAAG